MNSQTNLTQFSDTDTKLLIVLCNEMTADDACISCGVSYPYGIKRIGHLRKHGWLTTRQQGKQYLYSTVLSEETQHFFAIAQNATSKAPLLRIPNYYGTNPTVGEAISECFRNTQKYEKKLGSLPTFMGAVIATLKVRSHRKANGKDSQPPNELTLKQTLEAYVNQTERNLKLAKELLNTMKLWDGSPTTWKWISEGEPTEQSIDLYKKMGDVL